MPAISTILLGAALAGGALSQSHQASEQRKAAQKADAAGEQERQKLVAEQTALDAKTKVNDQRGREAADLQRRRAASAGGRSSTLLTGGAGLTEPAPTQRKTLLGT